MPRAVDQTVEYFEGFRNGETTVPNSPTLLRISQKLDAVAKVVVDDLLSTLRLAPEHQARIEVLKAQPRTAEKFAKNKILFEDVSSFEQFAVVHDWLAERQIRKPHTFFFSVGDDCVPVQAKVPKRVVPSTMHVVLGTTTGERKAPKYTDWAANDPTQDPAQKRFIAPLEALEIVRQPGFSAATVVKGCAYDADQIENDWRYGSEYACVEDKGQAKNSPKKQRSAALNACDLVHMLSDADDPRAEEVEICRTIRYEEYSDEGYDDDLDTSVTAGALMKATKKAVVDRQEEDLTRLMQNLVIGKLEVPRTSILCEHMVQTLTGR